MKATSSNGHRPAVVITGASTGIGAACAVDLTGHGFHVFAGVRRPADAERLRQQGAGQIEPVTLDVTDQASITAAVETVRQAVGPAGLAGLVNNAGIAIAGPLELIPVDILRRQLEVNVVGMVAVTQAFLPLLRVAHGRIVNIGSVNGFFAPPYFGPYTASKYALEALTDCLRVELRQWGIRVSIIEPVNVDTPIWNKSNASADQLAEQVSPERYDLYREDLAAVRETARKLAANAIPVHYVVDRVRGAMMSRHPRSRYPIGAESRLARWGGRLLPDFLRDQLLKKGLGLK
jgi:NAD(P)-dependent dehydrogenase (short-subunit alcohol dehydrogenase family)